MTPQGVIYDVDTCVARAREHAKLAAVMFDTQQEWAAVCAFYSAYHLLRASLINDPVFDDAHRLSRINSRILPEDRQVHKHSTGGLSKPAYGLNEIISVLYPAIRARYIRLHIASIDVRYGTGIRAISTDSLRQDLAEITRAFDDGEIICSLGAI